MQEKYLLKDISVLEQNVDDESAIKLLDEKKAALESIRKEKVNGFITRSRIQWLSDGEKPTSFFCQLESKSYTDKTIRKLLLSNGSETKQQNRIMQEMHKYYSQLFQAKK